MILAETPCFILLKQCKYMFFYMVSKSIEVLYNIYS